MTSTKPISISMPLSLVTDLLLMVLCTAMLAYLTWHALRSDEKIIVQGLGGVPSWVGWLIFIPFCGLSEFMLIRSLGLRRVQLFGDRIRLSSLKSSFDISLQDVERIYWIQEPSSTYTPEAALALSCPTPFGREIRFTPRSVAMVELIQQRVASVRHDNVPI